MECVSLNMGRGTTVLEVFFMAHLLRSWTTDAGGLYHTLASKPAYANAFLSHEMVGV